MISAEKYQHAFIGLKDRCTVQVHQGVCFIVTKDTYPVAGNRVLQKLHDLLYSMKLYSVTLSSFYTREAVYSGITSSRSTDVKYLTVFPNVGHRIIGVVKRYR